MAKPFLCAQCFKDALMQLEEYVEMFVRNVNATILHRSHIYRNNNHMEQRTRLFHLGEFAGRYQIVSVRIKCVLFCREAP